MDKIFIYEKHIALFLLEHLRGVEPHQAKKLLRMLDIDQAKKLKNIVVPFGSQLIDVIYGEHILTTSFVTINPLYDFKVTQQNCLKLRKVCIDHFPYEKVSHLKSYWIPLLQVGGNVYLSANNLKSMEELNELKTNGFDEVTL